MRKFIRHIFFFLVLFVSVQSMAQYEGSDTTIDQVYPPPPEDERADDESDFSIATEQSPVQLKKASPEKVEELKKEEAYWYANLEPEKKDAKAKTVRPQKRERMNSIFDQKWFQNLLWVIILCSFIAVVIWYLASSNIRLFSRQSKKIMDEEAAEELTDDIFGIPYEKEIQKAENAGNYRLAVRLWYLKTLREMADRNIIDYRHERTNNEYVNSLFGGRYYRDFFRLTRNFEYTWYGQFPLSSEGYDMMRRDFSSFKTTLA